MSTLMEKVSSMWTFLKLAAKDRIYIYALFCFVRLCWMSLAKTLALFNGGKSLIYGTAEEQRRAKQYEYSAHFVKAFYANGVLTTLEATLEHNCLYKHIRYVHPEDIMRDPDATLMGVGKDYAVFSVTRGRDIFKLEDAPFFKNFQQDFATHLYIIRTEFFLKLADEWPNPKAKIVLMNMTARCGSTLYMQMFSRMPSVRAFSEPWCFNDIHFLYRKHQVSLPQYKQLIKACYKLLFATEHSKSITHIVAKLTPYASAQAPFVKEMFPETVFYFLCRGVENNIRSMVKLAPGVLPLSLKYLRGPNSWSQRTAFDYDDPWWWNFLDKIHNGGKTTHSTSPIKDQSIERQCALSLEINLSRFEGTGIFFACQYCCFMKHRHLYKDVILYEKFMEDPEACIRSICSFTGMSMSEMPLTLDALCKDSQNGQFGKRGIEHIVLSQAVKDSLDQGFQRARCPVRMRMGSAELRELLLHYDIKN